MSAPVVPQLERVRAMLRRRGPEGVVPSDFALPDVCDGLPPIARVAARVAELRRAGHTITTTRSGPARVARYVLVADPDPDPAVAVLVVAPVRATAGADAPPTAGTSATAPGGSETVDVPDRTLRAETAPPPAERRRSPAPATLFDDLEGCGA